MILSGNSFPNIQRLYDKQGSLIFSLRSITSASRGQLLTGHGRLNSYFHRFKIKDNPMCPCKKGDQTVDHVIYHCPILTAERATLIRSIVTKGLQWPISKSDLINQFKQEFIKFCNKIDLENIQHQHT